MASKIRTYLNADRQWKREHRIAHARYQLSLATSEPDRRFWKDVLRANGAKLEA